MLAAPLFSKRHLPDRVVDHRRCSRDVADSDPVLDTSHAALRRPVEFADSVPVATSASTNLEPRGDGHTAMKSINARRDRHCSWPCPVAWQSRRRSRKRSRFSRLATGFKTKLDLAARPIAIRSDDPPEELSSARLLSIHPSASWRPTSSQAPDDGKKHPAIIWITGGDCNSIGDVWSRSLAEQRPDRERASARPGSS